VLLEFSRVSEIDSSGWHNIRKIDELAGQHAFQVVLTHVPPGMARLPQLEELFDVIDLWTVRDGRLYEHWDQFDWQRAFVQLGVQGLPQPFYDAAAMPYDP
jgi:hypothetical protein